MEGEGTDEMGRDRPYMMPWDVSVNKSKNCPKWKEGDAEPGAKIRCDDSQTPEKAVLAAQSAMRYHRQP